MSKYGYHINTVNSIKDIKPIGYFTIGGSFHIHVAEKPTEEQLDNLEKYFGFVWTDE